MTSSKVARRYAQAVLELAAEQGQLEAWGAEVRRLAQMVESPELLEQLTSPIVPDQLRLEAVKLVAERLGLSYPVQSFAVVVARHGRIADLGAIAQAYQDLLDRRLGRARATLTFAVPPSDSDLAAVVKGLERLSGKTIIPAVKVEPALIGGVMAELEGRTYDASLATRLSLIERQLSR